MINFERFFYDEKPANPAYSGKVPSGLKTKKDVLEVVSRVLAFPDYFGGNWDAFEECVRDLSWLPEGVIVLEHGDLPFDNDIASRRIYLEILSDAIDKLESTGIRSLMVIFPGKVEKIVKSVGS